uniref:Os01g0772200 protein n=1 Tax=Macrostomum lignano TaxID=282301 RepID=A0A1I8HJV1_9PLAT
QHDAHADAAAREGRLDPAGLAQRPGRRAPSAAVACRPANPGASAARRSAAAGANAAEAVDAVSTGAGTAAARRRRPDDGRPTWRAAAASAGRRRRPAAADGATKAFRYSLNHSEFSNEKLLKSCL